MVVKQGDISSQAEMILKQSVTTKVSPYMVYLPQEQLERSLYEEVNEVLSRLGGKWKGGRTKAHIFDHDPSSELKEVVESGIMPPKNPTAFFGTPDNVVQDMLNASLFYQIGISQRKTLRLLEPSAGKGAIARALRDYAKQYAPDDCETTLHCCEIVPQFVRILQADKFDVLCSDFLNYRPQAPYDGIVMNPPFAVEGDKLAYVTHVMHAWSMLAPEGMLVSVVPQGLRFNDYKKVKELRDLVEQYGGWQDVPAGAFKESGTGIKCLIISLQKPEEEPENNGIDEMTLRAKNIEAREVVSEFDNAYELTQAIELKVQEVEQKEKPVFGDSTWLRQAYTNGSAYRSKTKRR